MRVGVGLERVLSVAVSVRNTVRGLVRSHRGGVGVLDKGVEPPKRDRSWLYGGEMLL